MHRYRERDTEFEVRIADYSYHGNGSKSIKKTYISHDEVKKTDDFLPSRPYATHFITAKSHQHAKSLARRLGTVIFCRKVDPSFRLKKIEHINLHQEPIIIDIDRRGIAVSPSFGISPVVEEQNIVVEIEKTS